MTQPLISYCHNPYKASQTNLYLGPEESQNRRIKNLFDNHVHDFEQLTQIQDLKERSAQLTILLKRITGHPCLKSQYPLAKIVFNSLPDSTNHEAYECLLYILKKQNSKQNFEEAHNIFAKAYNNSALTKWTVTHYLSMGIEANELELLKSTINKLLNTKPDLVWSFLIKRFFEACINTQQTSELHQLIQLTIDKRVITQQQGRLLLQRAEQQKVIPKPDPI